MVVLIMAAVGVDVSVSVSVSATAMAMAVAVAVSIFCHSQVYSVVAWREEGTQQSTGGKVRKRFSSVDMASLLFCFSFSIQISHELTFLPWPQ